MTDPKAPTGMGVYLRALTSDYGTPAQAAKLAASNGVRFVALMGPWLDDSGAKRLRPKNLDAQFGKAFRDVGIDVHVWGYPDAGREDEFVDAMTAHVEATGACGVLLDPEKPYKGKPKAVQELIAKTFDALDESIMFGVTSFGRLDWHQLEGLRGQGWSSPQIYTVTAEAGRKAIASWDAPGAHIVPSVPAYGPNSEGALAAYLGAMEDLAKGYIVWSWPQISKLEWATIKRWSKRL